MFGYSIKTKLKEKINNWELIEGVKNASAICLSWYSASKLERKMLRYEYQRKLLIKHTHMSLPKDYGFFKVNLNLNLMMRRIEINSTFEKGATRGTE
jgi:hypothetical protein